MGARVIDFIHKNSKTKKKKNLGGGGGWGLAGGGRWVDRRTGPNQFAPSTFSKLGA